MCDGGHEICRGPAGPSKAFAAVRWAVIDLAALWQSRQAARVGGTWVMQPMTMRSSPVTPSIAFNSVSYGNQKAVMISDDTYASKPDRFRHLMSIVSAARAAVPAAVLQQDNCSGMGQAGHWFALEAMAVRIYRSLPGSMNVHLMDELPIIMPHQRPGHLDVVLGGGINDGGLVPALSPPQPLL